MASQSSLTNEDRDNLVAYLDGELDEAAARALEARLNLDPNARAEAEALLRTWELLDYLPTPQPSASFTHRTLDRISATARRGYRVRTLAVGLGWAAAVLVAVAAGYGGVTALTHRARPPVEDTEEADQQLVRDLRIIENRRSYEHVDDLEFLRGLDSPDLFGEGS